MRQAVPANHDLARRLLAYEASSAGRPAGVQAAESICEKLNQGLSKLVGPAGFQALLARALYLARAEYPFLQGVQGGDGSCFGGLAESATGQDPSQVNGALVAVFGNFIDLLSTFIGKDLAYRQVRRIWPEVPLSEAGSGAEEMER